MRPRRRTLAPLVLAAVLGASTVLGVSAGAGAAVTAAKPGASVVDPDSAARPYRLDLADANDFVAQTTFVQCVGASIQMMLNVEGATDRTARTQARLQTIARSLSGPSRAGFERKGASVRGWTDGLNRLDAGPYEIVGADALEQALRLAALAIRTTGRPVGLLMWAGRHAWVMSGFEATADPLQTDGFRVTRAIVLDPLYPYGSARWGRSPKPREAVTTSFLGRQFVPRRRGTWAGAPLGAAGQSLAALAGKYVIVLPFTRIVVDRNRPLAI
jgi:hypothetical protein